MTPPKILEYEKRLNMLLQDVYLDGFKDGHHRGIAVGALVLYRLRGEDKAIGAAERRVLGDQVRDQLERDRKQVAELGTK